MKLSGKFRKRYEEVTNKLSEIDLIENKSDELIEEKGYAICLYEILENLKNEVKMALVEANVNGEENKQLEKVEIKKFNTPDKVTDINDKEYQRVKGKNQILFKRNKEDKYFIITKL